MENPGKEELKRIINCMKDYEYDENSLEPGDFDSDYKFRLIKRLHDDNTIKVTIDFPTVIDNENTYENDDNGDFYNVENNDKAREFIENLKINNSTKKGGQKRKQRKTKKRRSHKRS